MAKAKAIAEKAPEDVKEKVRSGDISIHKAYSDIKQVEKREHKAAIAEQISREPEPNPLPDHDRGGNRGDDSIIQLPVMCRLPSDSGRGLVQNARTDRRRASRLHRTGI